MSEYEKTQKQNCCLKCGKVYYGRTDKKFCSPECKNDYHNQEYRYTRLVKNRIITELQSNYRILDNLLKFDVKSMDICELEHLGFRSSVVTGYKKTPEGRKEFRCFDIIYCQTPTKIINIRRQDFRKKD